MAGSSTKRVVIVSHPDFDQAGTVGIREAKSFAQTLLDGQKQMIAMAEKSGAQPADIIAVREYVRNFRIVIRSIDDEII